MKAIDYKMGAYYNYDASGERNLKLTGGTVDVTQNGYTMNVPVLDQQTLYASALVTINDKGYTKHYFEENKRVCSNIGGGFRDAGYDIMEPIGLITPFEDQWSNAKDGIFKTFEQCIKSPVDLENTKDKIVKVMKDHEKDRNEEEYQFYYTNDHLGSSTYITNKKGQITQTLAYLPYGELRSNREYLNVKNQNSHEQHWVDLDNTPPYITPYKYNGKEKDPETGYNYYGARYLNNDLSIWLSVDPLSDKYPHQTNYIYCSNNPVMVIDPDGRDEYDVNLKGELTRKNGNGGKDNNTLFALDKNGKRVKSLSLGESDIFSQLSKEKQKIKQVDAIGTVTREGVLRSSTSENKQDMAKTFMFLSQNTDVEWSLYTSNEGGKTNYGLGTFQWNDLSPSSSQVGLTGNISSMIHSHPNPKNYNSEIESMYGDKSAARRASYNYFMFAPKSGNFYQIGNQKGNIIPKGKVNNFQGLMKYMK